MAKLIRGITVTLRLPKQVGEDGFHRPVYDWVPVEVPDVLVSPIAADAVVDGLQLDGRRVVYELSIPKADDHRWEDARVDFFGKTWHTVGPVQQWIGENLPLRWDRKVQVEAYE